MDPYLKIASLEADYERLANTFRQDSVERAEMRKRIKELERGLPTYIAMLKRHLSQCPIANGVCTSCAHVQTLLLQAEALAGKGK